MKFKRLYWITGVILFATLVLREIGIFTFEKFSDSSIRYSLVKSSRTDLPEPYSKLVIRDESSRLEATEKRELGVLYVYVDGFVFDQDIGRVLPIYKNGSSESYLRFEFVFNEQAYAGGIVSVKSEGGTVGLRTLRNIKKAEFRNLVETALKFHGAENRSLTVFETDI